MESQKSKDAEKWHWRSKPASQESEKLYKFNNSKLSIIPFVHDNYVIM